MQLAPRLQAQHANAAALYYPQEIQIQVAHCAACIYFDHNRLNRETADSGSSECNYAFSGNLTVAMLLRHCGIVQAVGKQTLLAIPRRLGSALGARYRHLRQKLAGVCERFSC